jgi:serine/threonine protein kinase
MASPPPPAWEPVPDRGRPFLRATLPEAPETLPTFTVAETIAGRYRVEGLFAVGAISVLMVALDLRTRRRVLIKAIRCPSSPPVPPGARDEAWSAEVRRARHLLQTERRLLVRLRNAGRTAVPHPNDYVYDRNPALDGLGPALAESEPFLVLELISGTPLDERLATAYPRGMDEGRARELIAPVVDVLEVLHEPWRLRSGHTWHCVYQDLKPANILVDPSGRARLLDFGGCQVVVDGVPVLEGACTAGYRPPECEGPAARVLLPCADVYCIGSTLHHMLSGIDPRRRGGPGEPPDPRSLPARVSPPMRDLIARCLARRPSDRFADARQVSRALADLRRAKDLAPSP